MSLDLGQVRSLIYFPPLELITVHDRPPVDTKLTISWRWIWPTMFFHYVARGHGADQIHQENHHHHHDADSLPLYGAVEAGQCRYTPLWANQITMCTRDLPSESFARSFSPRHWVDDDDAHEFICHFSAMIFNATATAKYVKKKKRKKEIIKRGPFLATVPPAGHRANTSAIYIVLSSLDSIELDSSIIDWLPIVCKSCPLPIYNVRSTFSHWTLEILMFSGPFFSRQMAFFFFGL